MSNTLKLRTASLTNIGLVRTSQQDRAACFTNGGVVCDGMGGQNGGETAAETAIGIVVANFATPPATVADCLARVKTTLTETTDTVYSKSLTDRALRGMGTTTVFGCACQDIFVIGAVGDSRAYHLRNSVLTQVTIDHSIAAIHYRQGTLSAAEAKASRFAHVLYKNIGSGDPLDVDSNDVTFQVPLADGDRLLLCSDGIDKHLDEATIARILASSNDPAVVAQALIDAALAGGGSDNIAVVVIFVEK